MSKAPTESSPTGAESTRIIWDARRSAGLTEKALAQRLGVSLWDIERLEKGEVDPSPYAEALEEHTGRPRAWFRSHGVVERPQGRLAEDQGAKPDRISPEERTGERLVLGSIAALVLVRFFTEVAP